MAVIRAVEIKIQKGKVIVPCGICVLTSDRDWPGPYLLCVLLIKYKALVMIVNSHSRRSLLCSIHFLRPGIRKRIVTNVTATTIA